MTEGVRFWPRPRVGGPRIAAALVVSAMLPACLLSWDRDGEGGSGAGSTSEEHTCVANTCDITCEAGSDCEIACTTGALCTVRCGAAKVCDVSCAGGSTCEVSCGDAEECNLSCAASVGSIACNGAIACQVDNFNSTCVES